MPIDRRQLLSSGGLWLAAWNARRARRGGDLDALLARHADTLPENGGGANHYPMAAEALEALGRQDAIDEAWSDGASYYEGPLGRIARIDEGEGDTDPLGAYDRYGDWLDHFRADLFARSWHDVLAEWALRLAPGIAAGALHGVIRTAHAARALRRRTTEPRLGELAAGLAYWAARYRELPVGEPGVSAAPQGLSTTLETIEHPSPEDPSDVGFHDVVERMAARPVAPVPEGTGGSPAAELDRIVRASAAGFLEMLVQERHRIWVLHSVTAPAAVELLLPEVDEAGARALVAHVRQAVLALYAAFGAPYEAGHSVREDPGGWEELLERVVASRSIHGIKLTEALVRFDRDEDPLLRSVAAQWLEWE